MISVLEIKNKKITHNCFLFMGVKKIDKNTYLSLMIFFFFFFVLCLFVILISKILYVVNDDPSICCPFC